MKITGNIFKTSSIFICLFLFGCATANTVYQMSSQNPEDVAKSINNLAPTGGILEVTEMYCGCWNSPFYRMAAPCELCPPWFNRCEMYEMYWLIPDDKVLGPDNELPYDFWLDLDADADVDMVDMAFYQPTWGCYLALNWYFNPNERPTALEYVQDMLENGHSNITPGYPE